jgi:hypothetical protein
MEEQISWEANSHSASREIPRLLCNTNVHNRVHKSPSLVSILSQMNPIHYTLYFSKIHLNIVLPSTPNFPKWLLFSRFSDKNFVSVSVPSHACYISRQSYTPWLDGTNNIVGRVKVTKLLFYCTSTVLNIIILLWDTFVSFISTRDVWKVRGLTLFPLQFREMGGVL